MRKLSKYKDKIQFIYKLSMDASGDIPDNSLDFIYIDGNHSYDAVMSDLKLYAPKLKLGGIIGGHDFDPETLGVIMAVIEFKFTNYNKYSKIMSKKNNPERDWWMVKLKE